MAGEQEHAAGTGGQSGCGHLLHCFFTEVQENSRDTGAVIASLSHPP